MSARADVVTPLLAAPARAAGLDEPAWDLVVRQARRSDLLAALAHAIDDAGIGDAVPAGPRAHLEAARTLAEKHARDIRWELHCIARALEGSGVEPVVLKGGAYLLAGLACARGRLFRDVDLLVPREALADVERRLRDAGWTGHTPHAYDQRYYREWSHQLPPLVHFARGIEADIHHAILMPIARRHPDSRLLLDAAVPVAGDAHGYRVLAPDDMLLHSAAHLFYEGELERGLRDLLDLHELMGRVEGEAGWRRLAERARALELERPLHYAVRYVERALGAALPDAARAGVARLGPAPGAAALMDALYTRALVPSHPSCEGAGARLARTALFVRGHLVRMPLRVLIPHLARKSLRALRDEE